MKKILITGKNSYIGKSVSSWLEKEPDKYKVDSISLRDDKWKQSNFSQYDVIFHAAGIAHIKETKENQDLYYKINRDLVYEVAKKAKESGVKQFIFLSTMSVYGVEKGIIDENTKLEPKNAYGKSKIEAEDLLNKLADNDFRIAILRPPIVYGKGCKGNYPRLASLALKTPIFPNIDNERSMIYIDNLSEFVKQLIDNCDSGLFFPQNTEYVNTSEMVRLIAEVHGKKLRLTKLFNPILKLLNLTVVNKVFGNLVYKMDMSEYPGEFRVCDFKNSIIKTESKN